ncbi:MAG: efflux RND transporter periplasmic adaptor subunit [Planctomycetes bacterium]|nr:efflux RND transporter periplasmic adaptor subunit [Planctomycetota bacterium]
MRTDHTERTDESERAPPAACIRQTAHGERDLTPLFGYRAPPPVDLQSLKIDRGPKKATRRGSPGPWLLRILFLAAVGGAGWVLWPWASGFIDKMRLPEVQLWAVTESTPAAAAAVSGTAANGHLVATRRAALSSDVPGRIVELNVREGSVVQKDEVVARLYADEYRAALARAKAEQAVAEAARVRAAAAIATAQAEERQATETATAAAAQLEEARVQAKWAEQELGRQAELTGSAIESPRELQRVRAEWLAAEARVQSLTAAHAAAESTATTAAQRVQVAREDERVAAAQSTVASAAVALAQATLDKTDVKAPFAGIVVLKDAEIGEVVSPNVQGGSNARGAVCTLVDFESLEVQANVPETTLAAVEVGAPADVYLDGWASERHDGVVDRIWPTADRQKATIEVRIRLAKIDARMRPEMGVRVVFRKATAEQPTPAGDGQPRILVPEGAIVPIAGETGAFVCERDRVVFTRVATGERKNGKVAVDAGLRAGQQIVLDPPGSLQPGDRVRIKKSN